jgi:ribonuclease HI
MGDEYRASAEDHAEVVSRELSLLNPAVRSDPHRVRELLHPDFLEFGASGRRWNLEAVVEALAIDPSSPSQEPTELAPVHVADDVVLLTYRIDGQDGASLRSSLWVREGGSWRLRFHQGTPARPER